MHPFQGIREIFTVASPMAGGGIPLPNLVPISRESSMNSATPSTSSSPPSPSAFSVSSTNNDSTSNKMATRPRRRSIFGDYWSQTNGNSGFSNYSNESSTATADTSYISEAGPFVPHLMQEKGDEEKKEESHYSQEEHSNHAEKVLCSPSQPQPQVVICDNSGAEDEQQEQQLSSILRKPHMCSRSRCQEAQYYSQEQQSQSSTRVMTPASECSATHHKNSAQNGRRRASCDAHYNQESIFSRSDCMRLPSDNLGNNRNVLKEDQITHPCPYEHVHFDPRISIVEFTFSDDEEDGEMDCRNGMLNNNNNNDHGPAKNFGLKQYLQKQLSSVDEEEQAYMNRHRNTGAGTTNNPVSKKWFTQEELAQIHTDCIQEAKRAVLSLPRDCRRNTNSSRSIYSSSPRTQHKDGNANSTSTHLQDSPPTNIPRKHGRALFTNPILHVTPEDTIVFDGSRQLSFIIQSNVKRVLIVDPSFAMRCWFARGIQQMMMPYTMVDIVAVESAEEALAKMEENMACCNSGCGFDIIIVEEMLAGCITQEEHDYHSSQEKCDHRKSWMFAEQEEEEEQELSKSWSPSPSFIHMAKSRNSSHTTLQQHHHDNQSPENNQAQQQKFKRKKAPLSGSQFMRHVHKLEQKKKQWKENRPSSNALYDMGTKPASSSIKINSGREQQQSNSGVSNLSKLFSSFPYSSPSKSCTNNSKPAATTNTSTLTTPFRHSLMIGVSLALAEDGFKFIKGGADLLWGKAPPPRMDAILRNQILTALLTKRGKSTVICN